MFPQGHKNGKIEALHYVICEEQTCQRNALTFPTPSLLFPFCLQLVSLSCFSLTFVFVSTSSFSFLLPLFYRLLFLCLNKSRSSLFLISLSTYLYRISFVSLTVHLSFSRIAKLNTQHNSLAKI